VASFSQDPSALSGPNVVSALGTVSAGATVTSRRPPVLGRR
jgi:hypothetical protein